GDYNRIVNDRMLHSATNYECYKGIHSSLNSANMHEIGYSLNRQFGPEHWCIYRGKSMYSFVDNHDVSRIASILGDSSHIALAYGLIFTMPGIPSVYYGSEFAIKGDKFSGDAALRPCLTAADAKSMSCELTEFLKKLTEIRKNSPALCRGGYRQLYVNSKQLVFLREHEGERMVCAINSDNAPHAAHFGIDAQKGTDLLSGEEIALGTGMTIPANGVIIARI
ncbi:MAG: alpha-glucosidase C-terminal domain-containing protein, partial [Clostridia bacterium]|nr:alpha-glucosidase C-terminal domain-containing protein [Clostridia bacterium]